MRQERERGGVLNLGETSRAQQQLPDSPGRELRPSDQLLHSDRGGCGCNKSHSCARSVQSQRLQRAVDAPW